MRPATTGATAASAGTGDSTEWYNRRHATPAALDLHPVSTQGNGDPASGQRSRFVRLATRWGMAIILAGVVVNLTMAFLSIRSGALRTISRVSPWWLAVAVLLGLAPTVVHALRIRNWTGFLSDPTSARQSLRAAFGTELGSAISPKAIGGAPVKLALLVEAGQRTGTAASIILLNNIEDVLFFVAVMPAVVFLTASWEVPAIQEATARIGARVAVAAPWLIGIAAAIVVAILVRRWLAHRRDPRHDAEVGPVRRALRRMRGDFLITYALIGKRGKARFLVGVGLATLQWLCRCSVATAVMLGLGESVDPVLFLLLQWVVWATMVFVPTPGAALGAEASFAAVFAGFVPGSLLGLVGAAWRFLSFYLVLIAGLVIVPALGARASRGDAGGDPGGG